MKLNDLPATTRDFHRLCEIFVELPNNSTEASEVLFAGFRIEATEEFIGVHAIKSLTSDSLEVTADMKQKSFLLLDCRARGTELLKLQLALRDLSLDISDERREIAADVLQESIAETAAQAFYTDEVARDRAPSAGEYSKRELCCRIWRAIRRRRIAKIISTNIPGWRSWCVVSLASQLDNRHCCELSGVSSVR